MSRGHWLLVGLIILAAASIPAFALVAIFVGPLFVVANSVLYFRLRKGLRRPVRRAGR